jgi:hypothetical protein
VRNVLIILKMEAAYTSETLINFHETTRHNNPDFSHLQGRKVFENRKLKKIFIPKTVEVTEDHREPHNEELHTCALLQILRSSDQRMRYERSVVLTGEMKNT